MKKLIILAALALSACGPEANMQMREQSANANTVEISTNARVEVTRIGVFRDDLAYDDKRGVYLIVDQETGAEFIGISGIGISELGSHRAGKTHRSDER